MDNHAKHGEAHFLKWRYKHTQMKIDSRDGNNTIVEPHMGGLQGDACMANVFRVTYDALLEEWDTQRSRTWDGATLMASVP
jgi:hypothetical protein